MNIQTPTAWNLLRDENDWTIYQQNIASKINLPVAQIAWGTPPQTFPCLTTSVSVAPGRVLSAHVYYGAAKQLTRMVEALKGSPSVDEMKAQEASPQYDPNAEGQDAPAESAETTVQAEHNRSVNAHVLTIIKLLVDTGIVKEDKYEQRYQAMLADVDQSEQEQLYKLLTDPRFGRPFKDPE